MRLYSSPGADEILCGVGLLVERTRRMAAWGLILLLAIYFDVHIFMLMYAERFPSIPVWMLYLRIPLQFVFIAWAWVYTRGFHEDTEDVMSMCIEVRRQRERSYLMKRVSRS